MRRWYLRILLCLILGAITTVAVAWGLAYVSIDSSAPMRYTSVLTHESANVDLGIDRQSQWHSELWIAMRGRGPLDDDAIPLVDAYAMLPSWSGLRQPGSAFANELISSEIRWVMAFGWPVQSLFFRGRTEVVAPTAQNPWRFHIDAGLEHNLTSHPNSLNRAFPLRPIWPAFLIDTLFYAAIWFGVFFAPGMAKRAIRRKRGRCPRCGYDLRGQREGVRGEPPATSPGCPECGWRRE